MGARSKHFARRVAGLRLLSADGLRVADGREDPTAHCGVVRNLRLLFRKSKSWDPLVLLFRATEIARQRGIFVCLSRFDLPHRKSYGVKEIADRPQSDLPRPT